MPIVVVALLLLLFAVAAQGIDTTPTLHDATQNAYISVLESRLGTAEFWAIPDLFKTATARAPRVTLIATNTPRATATPTPMPTFTPAWTPEFVIIPPTPTREILQVTVMPERCFLIVALAGQSVRDEPNGNRQPFGANYGSYIRVRDSELEAGYEWGYSDALGGWVAISIAEQRPLDNCN